MSPQIRYIFVYEEVEFSACKEHTALSQLVPERLTRRPGECDCKTVFDLREVIEATSSGG